MTFLLANAAAPPNAVLPRMANPRVFVKNPPKMPQITGFYDTKYKLKTVSSDQIPQFWGTEYAKSKVKVWVAETKG